MNPRNLFLSFFTFLFLSYGNVVFADAGGDVSQTKATATTVNINHADAETLASMLDGIGLSRAQAIISYREANGLFYSAEELSDVSYGSDTEAG